MELKEDLKKALVELRKTEKRKFDQSVDLIINLQKYDLKKNPINLFLRVPHKIKEKKIGAFLEVSNKDFTTITPSDFRKYENKQVLKKLVGQFDFFIAQASVMPKVATTFGRVLGPAGKMPSPQMGIVMDADSKTLNDLRTKINESVRIRTKESSIKLAVGKESMKDENIIENIMTIYNATLKALTRDKDNIKNIELKFTMTKPQKIKVR